MTALAHEARALVRSSLGLDVQDHVWDRLHGDGVSARVLATSGQRLDAQLEAVVCIGAFDGFHVGHRLLMEQAQADAKERGVPCCAIMFDPDPAELFLDDKAPTRLLSCSDRARMIASTGVEVVVMLSFDEGLAALTPSDFVERVLLGLLKPVAIHVGSNFNFGRDGAGDVDMLRTLCRPHGIDVKVHELVERAGMPVSSTRIRELLREGGSLEEANELLGRCHFLPGVVRHGRGEGTTFGFPTANVHFSRRLCLPAQGVYAGFVTLGTRAWPAAINVGAPPTFDSTDEAFCEANLLGFSANLYESEVAVTFVSWLRPSRPFDSLDDLKRVVLDNIEWVRTHLGDSCVEVGHDN